MRRIGLDSNTIDIMRLLSLLIAIAVLAGVGYITLTTPSHAAVYDGATILASAR